MGVIGGPPVTAKSERVTVPQDGVVYEEHGGRSSHDMPSLPHDQYDRTIVTPARVESSRSFTYHESAIVHEVVRPSCSSVVLIFRS